MAEQQPSVVANAQATWKLLLVGMFFPSVLTILTKDQTNPLSLALHHSAFWPKKRNWANSANQFRAPTPPLTTRPAADKTLESPFAKLWILPRPPNVPHLIPPPTIPLPDPLAPVLLNLCSLNR